MLKSVKRGERYIATIVRHFYRCSQEDSTKSRACYTFFTDKINHRMQAQLITE